MLKYLIYMCIIEKSAIDFELIRLNVKVIYSCIIWAFAMKLKVMTPYNFTEDTSWFWILAIKGRRHREVFSSSCCFLALSGLGGEWA